MKLQTLKSATALFGAVLLIGACTDGSADRFVGEWHRVEFPKQSIVIKREGSGQISLTGNPWPAGTMVGQVTRDKAIFDQFTTASFKGDGTLVFGSREFVK